MRVEQAIIPAAGFGSRLRPLSYAIPKEMLPLGRKPVLEHVLDEMRSVGMRRVIFVISPGKEIVRQYFGDGSKWGVQCEYAVQPEMKGLGDALLIAEHFTEGNPALVAFGDCIIDAQSDQPSSRLLTCFHDMCTDAAVLTQRISRERISRYGVMKPARGAATTSPFRIEDIVEKPAPEEAPSEMAVAGRWVLGPRVFDLLRETSVAANGELNLTDAVRRGLSISEENRLSAWAVPLNSGEARRDIGSWETYLTAAAEFAMRDAEFGSAVRRSVCG